MTLKYSYSFVPIVTSQIDAIETVTMATSGSAIIVAIHHRELTRETGRGKRGGE